MSLRSASARGSWSRSGTTVHTSSAIPSSVRTCAERTDSRCSASTPAMVANRPVRSGAATVTVQVTASSGSARTASRPAATSALCAGVSGGGGGGGAPCRRSAVRRTRSSTSPAFHSLHAAGPVASASARVRAASSSSTSVVPSSSATAATVAGSSRSRRVAFSTSSRWCRTSSPMRRDVVGVEAHPRARRRRRAAPRPRCGRPAEPLPMSCSRAATSSRSGPVHLADQRGRLHRGLEQVPVDAEPVHRVALRPVPHQVPLGQQPGDQPGLVERLPDRHQRRPGAEQLDEQVPGVLRPRLRQRRGCRRPAGRPSSATAAARSGRRGQPSAARAAGRRAGRPAR